VFAKPSIVVKDATNSVPSHLTYTVQDVAKTFMHLASDELERREWTSRNGKATDYLEQFFKDK
jgi:hypothetical protein